MAMSRDVVLRLVGDAESAKRALHESAEAAGVTVREYRRAETLQRQQAAQAKRLAAEQEAAAQVVGASMLKMGAVVTGALALGVKAAVDWESAFADVKKVMKDPAMFGTVEAQLRQLTSVLPATHAEIAGVAAAAAQLGVEDRNLASFTKTMVMLGTTTSMNAEEASFAIARFSNIMGTSYSQASNLGSAIVWLGNNFAATEGEIVQMAMRLAGAGKQAGMTESDILGMATAFAAVGINAEAGGTALSKFMTMIGNSVRDGGQQLDRFAKLAGTTANEFAKQWRDDPGKALASVVAGMGNLQKAGGDLNGELDKLGITEQRMRDGLLRSSAAGDQLTNAITGANDAFAENNALQEEANQRYETTASQLQLLRNGVVEAGISLGQALLPALNAVVDVVSFVIDGFNNLPGPVKASIAILMGIVGASALAGGAMIKLKGQAAELRGAFATMTGAGGFVGKLGGFLGLLGPIAAGVGIVTAAVSILSGIFSAGSGPISGYEDHVRSMTDALQESNGAIDSNIRALAAQRVVSDAVSIAGKTLAERSKELGIDLGLVTDAVLGSKDAYEQIAGAIDQYIAGLDETSQAYGAQKSSAEGVLERIGQLRTENVDAAEAAKLQAEATGEAAGAMDGQATAAALAGQSTDEYAQAQADAADAAAETKQAVDELKNAFDRLNGANIDMLQATSSMTLALQGMQQAVAQNGLSLDASTEGGAKNTQMLIDMAKKAGDVVTATLQQTGSMEEATAAYGSQRKAILDAAAALGLNKTEVDALLDSIFKMPAEMLTSVTVSVHDNTTDVLTALDAVNVKTKTLSDGSIAITDNSPETMKKLAALNVSTTTLADGTVVLTDNTGEILTNLSNVNLRTATLKDGSVVVTDNSGSVIANLNAIDAKTIRDKSYAIYENTYRRTYTSQEYAGRSAAYDAHLADGGHVKFFAGGGEHHVAQYAKAGTWRVWAEPETGGEWYLPDAMSKRPRSLSIAGQMLDGWGYQMVPKGAQQYAYGAYAYGQHAYGAPTHAAAPTVITADVVRAELHVNDGALAGMVSGVVELRLNSAARRGSTMVTL